MQVQPGKRDVRKQLAIPNDRFGKDALAILGVDENPRLPSLIGRPMVGMYRQQYLTALGALSFRRFAYKYFQRPKSRLADAQQALVVLFAGCGKQRKSFGQCVLSVQRNRRGNEMSGWVFVAHRLQGAPQSFQ